MSKKIKWFWEVCFILYAVLTIRRAVEFFSPHSEIFFYYYFLCAFDHHYLFIYVLNLLQIIFNLWHCLPMGFYTYDIFWLRPKVWQYLLMMKIVFDVMGNSYDKQLLLSLYHSDPKIALTVFLQGFIFQIPAYIACYRYAFRRRP